MSHRVYFHNTYRKQLRIDFQKARGRIINFSAYATPDGVQLWLPEFKAAIKRGVHVCAFIQEPDGWEHRNDPEYPLKSGVRIRIDRTMRAIEMLEEIGVHVELREDMHEKLVIIDDHILWDGSLNFLSHFKTTERLHRWDDRREVALAIKDHRAHCRVYSEMIYRFSHKVADAVARRRRLLGWTQQQLAANARTSQDVISQIETAGSNATVGLIERVLDALQIKILIVDRFFSYRAHYLARGQEQTVDGKLGGSNLDGLARPAETIGRALVRKRETLFWKQTRTAKYIGIEQSLLSRLESGKRNASIQVIDRVLNKLDLDVVLVDARISTPLSRELALPTSSTKQRPPN